MKANLNWIQGMQFECDNHGLKTMIDATAEHGGSDSAPNPKELVLNAMMGCTAMDVVAMLTKMRQQIETFHMDIEAQKTTHHPTHFKSAQINYVLKGNLEAAKVLKAVEASMTKYCGVNFMISQTCEISYKVTLNGEEIGAAPVNFITPPSE